MDEVVPKMGIVKRPSSSIIPGSKSNSADASKKEGWPISFRHLGRKGAYELTLFAGTPGNRKKWLELIGEQQEKLRTRGDGLYNNNVISSNFFTPQNRVNCLAPFGKPLFIIYIEFLLTYYRWWS